MSSTDEEFLDEQPPSSDEDINSDEAGSVTEEEDESQAGETEGEDSDDDEEPMGQVPDINASSTESDDDDEGEVDDDEDVVSKPKKVEAAGFDKVTQKIREKYEERKGKQLYIRFPNKLPEDVKEFEAQAKALSDLIVAAHKPRQKHARFCLVDFASVEDRDLAFKKLSKKSAEEKLVVSLPRTEEEGFVKMLTEKKMKQIERKRAKRLLKRESKKAVHQKEFTSTIVVHNIPKSASSAEVRKLFPDAVDIQIKPAPSKFDGVSTATITLPSTADARTNTKRSLTLGGNKLVIRFNVQKKKKKKPAKKAQQGKKGPLAPPPEANDSAGEAKPKAKKAKKAKKPLGSKRSSDDESTVPKKKIKVDAEAGKKPKPAANGKAVQNQPKAKVNKADLPKKGVPNKKAGKPNAQKKQKGKKEEKKGKGKGLAV